MAIETGKVINRRRHERFQLSPGYAAVRATRRSDRQAATMDGHAYDISESGIRIELDEALPVGEQVELHIELPGLERAVNTPASVVWLNDELDDPGPRRMALSFDPTIERTQRATLLRHLGQSGAMRAA